MRRRRVTVAVAAEGFRPKKSGRCSLPLRWRVAVAMRGCTNDQAPMFLGSSCTHA